MVVGVLGGGQLGRMLALAGVPLGLSFRFLDPSPESPARDVGELIRAPYDDAAALERLARGVSVATYEFENVPVASVERLVARCPVRPGAESLRVAQDRALEKEFFARAGLAVHAWRSVASLDELLDALAHVGLPAMLKTRRGGYDGKGQARIASPADAPRAWESIARRPAIVESLVPFTRELSVVGVRGVSGEFRAYPIIENAHEEGILSMSRSPARCLDAGLARDLTDHTRRLMELLGHVGVLAVEFFEAGGRVLANEMAPRVHNSGHWTIDGAATSQFENHLRAILDWPLGDASLRAPCAAMVNVIGSMPDARAVLAIPGARLHDYAKAPRAGRKVGHVTLVGDEAGVDEGVRRVRDILAARPGAR